MKIFKYKKISLILMLLALLMGVSSCVDDGPEYRQNDYDPAQDPEMVCLPLNICYDYSTATRADEPSSEDDETEPVENDPGFADGNGKEHAIDFDKDKECFAIFFGPDKNDENNVNFKYIRRLYTSDQLGIGGKIKNDTKAEFTVPVICYIPKDDCIPCDENGNELTEKDAKTGEYIGFSYWKPNLLNVLVVLNGAPIYDKLHDFLYDTNTDGTFSPKKLSIVQVLNFTWDNPADYSKKPYNGDKENSLGEIGKNKNGNYTMTSSAYWKKNEQGKYDLMTAARITGKAYDSIKKFLDSGDEEPTATVYVERMLAKFSAPTFETAVIGSNRVFRPDQNAMALVVYTWNNNNEPVATQKNWRIHLIGWAINGTESSSYLFKNIGNVASSVEISNVDPYYIENDRYPDWNQPDLFRTYWSVDPHYSSGPDAFYPWQFRKAADRSDIISIQAGLTEDSEKIQEPVLRYRTFRDLLEKTDWQPFRYVHENTFDPQGDWYNRFTDDQTHLPDDERAMNSNYLDGRASLLAGPHLIIGGELYLEDEGNDYVVTGGRFGKVNNIYSDRLRRFYKTEVDWFKMFVNEINKTLEAQETMSFSKYDWDENNPTKTRPGIVIQPEGSPRVFFEGQELTFDRIEELAADKNVSFSNVANVRNGDGRLIPWLEKKVTVDGKEEIHTLEIRLTQDGRERKDAKGNSIQKKRGDLMYYTENGNSELKDTWDIDLYKSLFYEWFGPIDHYNKGYMYYAGEIIHKRLPNGNHFFGTVRNHWYTFHVKSINSLGVPVDDPDQLIIPGNFNYNDQIIVHMDVVGWHTRPVFVDIP